MSEHEHNGNEVWRVIAVAALSLMLGAGGEWFFRGRDAVTKDDLVLAVSPMQKQLDDISRAQGINSDEITALKVEVATLTAEVKLMGGKRNP